MQSLAMLDPGQLSPVYEEDPNMRVWCMMVMDLLGLIHETHEPPHSIDLSVCTHPICLRAQDPWRDLLFS